MLKRDCLARVFLTDFLSQSVRWRSLYSSPRPAHTRTHTHTPVHIEERIFSCCSLFLVIPPFGVLFIRYPFITTQFDLDLLDRLICMCVCVKKSIHRSFFGDFFFIFPKRHVYQSFAFVTCCPHPPCFWSSKWRSYLFIGGYFSTSLFIFCHFWTGRTPHSWTKVRTSKCCVCVCVLCLLFFVIHCVDLHINISFQGNKVQLRFIRFF